MVIDAQRIRTRLAYIQEQITAIQSLTSTKAREEILADPWVVRGIKYALQTAIEAMIDIAYHVAAKQFNMAPTDSRHALGILAEKGLYSQDELRVYGSMISFRNRVVHGYQEVDADRVYALATRELSDFESFVHHISLLLE